MRTCANCGKSNLPTRKFCIRCGRSLLSTKSAGETTRVVQTESPRVVHERTEKLSNKEPPTPVDESQEWVKPSEVSRDRVRTSTSKDHSEMDKAKAAFAKADAVGIDEDDSGVVETRMLRASEVKELMEGVAEMGSSERDESEPERPPGPPPIGAPSAKDIESQILGSMSAYVEPEDNSPVEEPFPAEFTSAKYDSSPSNAPELIVQTPEAPVPVPINLDPKAEDEFITTCPKCGELVNIDSFEYPREIYSAMGVARMKQARFFIVQGRYEEAQRIVRIARSLYLKADDTQGLAEFNKLVDSLARRS